MQWAAANAVRLISCRLPAHAINEGMALESFGFRFVEMVLHPRFNLSEINFSRSLLQVSPVSPQEVEVVAQEAQNCFGSERFHIDPRISSASASLRYGNWIRSSYAAPNHQLLGVRREDGELVAFFLSESTDTETVFWRLTAVLPHLQGRGYGISAWEAVLGHHQLAGVRHVMTTISARNTRVLNLYSHLRSRFDPPETTYHWVSNN